jgi:hypothetical protein
MSFNPASFQDSIGNRVNIIFNILTDLKDLIPIEEPALLKDVA